MRDMVSFCKIDKNARGSLRFSTDLMVCLILNFSGAYILACMQFIGRCRRSCHNLLCLMSISCNFPLLLDSTGSSFVPQAEFIRFSCSLLLYGSHAADGNPTQPREGPFPEMSSAGVTKSSSWPITIQNRLTQ
jgi:hypothetical protein